METEEELGSLTSARRHVEAEVGEGRKRGKSAPSSSKENSVFVEWIPWRRKQSWEDWHHIEKWSEGRRVEVSISERKS